MAAKPKRPTKKTAKPKRPRAVKTEIPKIPTTAPLLPGVRPAYGERIHRYLYSAGFGRLYVGIALAVLLVSTIWWSWLGAQAQQANADQLVNPYLFDPSARSGAILPATHSFLLKWPLFMLIKALNYSALSYQLVTIGLVALTVGGVAYILYRIERRPLIVGTICLALASCLLAIPAQPYAGALLPVNMAMIATRNIEYLWFVGCLILLAQSHVLKEWKYALATIGLATLFVSDRLFLSLSVGGACAGLFIFALMKRWYWVGLCARWLASSLLAVGGAALAIAIINAHVVHLADQATVSPYGLGGSAHSLLVAALYGLLGVLTNFGANPASGTTILANVPGGTLQHLHSLGSWNLIVNIIVFVIGVVAVGLVLRASLGANDRESPAPSRAQTLTVMLVLASLAALAAFLFTKHAYAVDARYLTILLFTVFIGFATLARTRSWPTGKLLIAGGLILIGMIGATFGTIQVTRQDKAVLADTNTRNALITQVLASHHVDTLVGDYWRVVPAKALAGSRQSFNISPLASCTRNRDVLTSTAWQPNLHKHSFAYLLSLDRSLTDYPQCNLQQVVSTYGAPNATTLIAGSLDHPKELLLFYDAGIPTEKPATAASVVMAVQTVLPIMPEDVPNPICDGPTVMNIVAHQDDDLLFINPDVVHDIAAGRCVRTIYFTAGDAGSGKYYMLDRELGSEDAYGVMLGSSPEWVQRVVKLGAKQFVTIASPRGNSKVSLIFMHLPDGNLGGDGFAANHYESLARLRTGRLSHLHTIDEQSVYSSSELVHSVARLMRLYQPSEIRTQSNYVDQTYPDHSDHSQAGYYASLAAASYEHTQFEDLVKIPLFYYIGYPVHSMAENIDGQALAETLAPFLAYARHDGGVCRSEAQCYQTPTYNAYLKTQYQAAE